MEHLLPYLLLALSLIGSLLLFLSLKYELYGQSRKHRVKMDALAARLLAAEERETFPEAPGPPARSGLNLNRRVQALRMLRRGETASHIAAALGVLDREVELLIRVQQIANNNGTADSIPAPR